MRQLGWIRDVAAQCPLPKRSITLHRSHALIVERVRQRLRGLLGRYEILLARLASTFLRAKAYRRDVDQAHHRLATAPKFAQRNRRQQLIAFEPTTAAEPWRREPHLMPPSGHCGGRCRRRRGGKRKLKGCQLARTFDKKPRYRAKCPISEPDNANRAGLDLKIDREDLEGKPRNGEAQH